MGCYALWFNKHPSYISTFCQQNIADVFDVSVLAYLAGILIYPDNMEDHHKHIN